MVIWIYERIFIYSLLLQPLLSTILNYIFPGLLFRLTKASEITANENYSPEKEIKRKFDS